MSHLFGYGKADGQAAGRLVARGGLGMQSRPSTVGRVENLHSSYPFGACRMRSLAAPPGWTTPGLPSRPRGEGVDKRYKSSARVSIGPRYEHLTGRKKQGVRGSGGRKDVSGFPCGPAVLSFSHDSMTKYADKD